MKRPILPRLLPAGTSLFLAILFVIGLAAPMIYADDRGITVKGKKGAASVPISNAKYYALIIGNNNYKNLPKLKTAVADASEVEKILKEHYSFETKLLLDATRKEILSSINDFRKKLGQNDNFLIYYAGHGEFEKISGKAYWLPVDAQKDDPVDWIMADDITSNIKRIASRHILVVSDSCYSGTLTRAAATDLTTKGSREEFVKKMMERSSRTLMASGGNEPVADEGSGGHSVFAAAILDALEDADKNVFTAEEMFHSRVKVVVAGKSEQVPEYNDIRNSGHEGGDFVFQHSKAVKEAAPDTSLQEPEAIAPAQEPKDIDFSLEGLEKKSMEREKQLSIKSEKTRLAALTQKMQTAFNKVIEFEKKKISPDDKAEAWKYFKDTFNEDNPYSQEDDAMRQKAKERMDYWLAMAKRPKGGAGKGIEGMIFVKGGCFEMGDTSGDGESYEKPSHAVCVADFYMGGAEVTQAEWQDIMGNSPSYFKDCDTCPVENVSWNDIQEYIKKLNQRTGKNYRLPTEAEWEYAARSGGKKEKWAGTGAESELGEYAWYGDNSEKKTHPVKQKKPNGLGLYDMSGNVWEWVSDWYNDRYYESSPKNNPNGPSTGSEHALRGGSWLDNPRSFRLTSRNWHYPVYRDNHFGFRLASSAR
ncbi:MAG: SUMF1/EgtB/PvdO family nonheme iron enzyme [Deltaproteobacteria bacterium]|nr:SUMF1/EgtB/PvdO family nonheme iron enzyme [Deltaproteobacteria bacterium]